MDISDFDIREERVDHRQSIKKPIQLKIKTSSNLIIPTNINNHLSSSNNDSFHAESDEKSSNSINFLSDLNWSHNINKIGYKILNKKMNTCISCSLPILIFGRLLPCKHFICFDCASKISPKVCLRQSCGENVERIEKVNAGRIFVCGYEQDVNLISDSNDNEMEVYEKNRCGRSYMSQRDLDAHINHRHLPNIMME